MFGVSAKCPRCTKSVYAAEEVLAASKKWHRKCFNCAHCHSGLDSTNLSERQGEIYCKSCYGKNFGPTGYGYGQGAGVLSNTGVAKTGGSSSAAAVAKFCGQCGSPATPGAKFCASCGAAAAPSSAPAPAPAPSAPAPAPAPARFKMRPQAAAARAAFGQPNMNVGGAPRCGACGKAVYHAEKVIAASQSWHRSCFRCTHCKKGLDSSNVRDNGGKIYCSACHSQSFGPSGFGYGHTLNTHGAK